MARFVALSSLLRENPHYFYLDIPNIPPTVQTGDEKSSSSSRAPCKTSDGRIYNDGERYPSNTTGLRPTSEHQCVMCVCQVSWPVCTFVFQV